jgi:plasmid rolling circle replication initiator protein Rep
VLHSFCTGLLSRKERSRRTGQALAMYFLEQGDDFSRRKGTKIASCVSNLEPKKDQEELNRAHRYCQDRFCPSCSWWKSEQLKKRFESVRPAVEEAYPDFKWMYITLTLTPCLTEMLGTEIQMVGQGFCKLMKRMKRRGLEVPGYYRFTELDKFSEEDSRIHLHAVLLVSEEGMHLMTEDWLSGLWSESMVLNYMPRVKIDWKEDERAVYNWIGYSSKSMVNPGDELGKEHFEWITRIAPYVHGKRMCVSGGVIRSYFSKAKSHAKVNDIEFIEYELSSPVNLDELGMLDGFAGETINTQYKQDMKLQSHASIN